MKGFTCQRQSRLRLGQCGASAVEFILVFPVLLMIAYSAVVYGYVYMLQQAINYAAQQAAQAAVSVLPGTSGNTQTTTINNTVNTALAWLPASQKTRLSVPSSAPLCLAAGTTGVIPVEVDFTVTGLFPVLLNLPFIGGTVPVLPAKLFACAVAFP
jgi:Flp pilus assembly protein TadG